MKHNCHRRRRLRPSVSRISRGSNITIYSLKRGGSRTFTCNLHTYTTRDRPSLFRDWARAIVANITPPLTISLCWTSRVSVFRVYNFCFNRDYVLVRVHHLCTPQIHMTTVDIHYERRMTTQPSVNFNSADSIMGVWEAIILASLINKRLHYPQSIVLRQWQAIVIIRFRWAWE